MNSNKKLGCFVILTSVIAVIVGYFYASSYDFRHKPLVGDTASYVMQTLSLANDFDLRYDSNDQENWQDLGWVKGPNGLFFQKYKAGFAFAKPYGYSVFLAPFYLVFGNKGFILGNYTIFVLLGGLLYSVLKIRYSTTSSLLLSLSFLVFSYCYFYIFFIHVDLFYSLLSVIFVFLFIKSLESSSRIYGFAAGIVAAFFITEKIAVICILIPLLAFLLYEKRDVIYTFKVILLSSIAWLVFVLPYLYYSDFEAVTPYSGERYTSNYPKTIFDYKNNSDIHRVHSRKHFEASSIFHKITDFKSLDIKAKAIVYYVFGSYTGMFVFMPVCLFLFLVYLYNLPGNITKFTVLIPIALLFYILFYIWFFPTNYYGGGQSVGNRYFLQVFPFFALLAYAVRLSPRTVFTMSFLSCLVSLAFLSYHHKSPDDAHLKVTKRGYFQSFLPFEYTQLNLSLVDENTLLNLKLYPFKPQSKRIWYDKKTKEKDETVFIEDTFGPLYRKKNVIIGINEKYTKLKKIKFQDIDIFVNQGFYSSEKTHIWSGKNSSLYLQNTGGSYEFEISTLINGTNVIASFGDRVIDVSNKTVVVDTKSQSAEWVEVAFEADQSAIPPARGDNRDMRDLSFRISGLKILSNRD